MALLPSLLLNIIVQLFNCTTAALFQYTGLSDNICLAQNTDHGRPFDTGPEGLKRLIQKVQPCQSHRPKWPWKWW